MWPWQETQTESYLVVGVGWSGSLNLHKDTTDGVSKNQKKVQWGCDTAVVPRAVDLLPALTLAVLDEGQLDELVLHVGGPHQLRTDQKMNCSGQLLGTEAVKFACLGRYLHGERVREQGDALQGLVGAATAASPQRHAGWDEKTMRLAGQLPPHLHQGVPRLASTSRVHLQPPPHWWGHEFAHLLTYSSATFVSS